MGNCDSGAVTGTVFPMFKLSLLFNLIFNVFEFLNRISLVSWEGFDSNFGHLYALTGPKVLFTLGRVSF